MALFKFMLNKHKYSTIWKSLFLKAFLDAEVKLAYPISITKMIKMAIDEGNNNEALEDTLNKMMAALPEAQERRKRFVFEKEVIKVYTINVAFDTFVELAIEDNENKEILYKHFDGYDEIKKFIDMFFIDAIAYTFGMKKDAKQNEKNSIPLDYSIFFVTDKSFLEQVCELYSKTNLKVDPKKIKIIMENFDDYCSDENRLCWTNNILKTC